MLHPNNERVDAIVTICSFGNLLPKTENENRAKLIALLCKLIKNLDFYCFEQTPNKIFRFRAISIQTPLILAHLRGVQKIIFYKLIETFTNGIFCKSNFQ